jgi:hypothetical protein
VGLGEDEAEVGEKKLRADGSVEALDRWSVGALERDPPSPGFGAARDGDEDEDDDGDGLRAWKASTTRWGQRGAPRPAKAGTRQTPPESGTPAARASTSADDLKRQ